MGALCLMELRKAFEAKWCRASFAFLSFLAFGSAIVSAANGLRLLDSAEKGVTQWIGISPLGCYASWIGIGSMDQSPFKALYCYMVPLAVLVPYAWSLRAELNSGYIAQIYVRCKRYHYLFAKIAAAFLSSFSVVAASLLLNFIVLSSLLPAYTPLSSEVLYIGIYSSDPYANIFYCNPLLYIILNICIEAFLCGFWSVLVLSIGFLVKDSLRLVLGSFVAMLFARYVNVALFQAMGVRGFDFTLFGFIDHIGDYCLRSPDAMLVFAIFCCVVSFVICALHARRDVICVSYDYSRWM